MTLWQATFYNQNEISMNADCSKLASLMRPVGRVFKTPGVDYI
jgi:hypothetical protein